MADEDQRPPEGPDDPITLKRAAELAGLTPATLRQQALVGRLQTTQPARDLFTTRRWLHIYLTTRNPNSPLVAPLPADYRTPEGEEPIP